MRIDGYAYEEAVGWDAEKILESDYRFGESQTGSPPTGWRASFLQRSCRKWGGEQLPRTSTEWKAGRHLYLDRAHMEIVSEFQGKLHFGEESETNLKAHHEEYIKSITEVQESVAYSGQV